MGRRGRNSQARLTVIEGGSSYDPQRRMEPPVDMTEQQKAIWREIIRSEPVELLSSAWAHNRLREYCEAAVGLRGVQKALNEFDMTWVKSKEGGRKYRELQKARAADLADMRGAARDLRLTNQSRILPRGAGTAAHYQNNTQVSSKFPWEL